VGARSGTDVKNGGNLVDLFRQDVLENRLPQVSWIVAPESYTEHPNWPANYGAWYIAQFLDALTANPAVWSKTALFLMYDENDGFFDHMVPPTAPQSRAEGLSTVDTTNEVFAGSSGFMAGPLGLGVRVPMIVISPWSKGGWVASEVFDHTSLIRFVERRFGPRHPGLIEKNITPWRRAVAGDLTSAFDFKRPNDAIVTLPGTDAYAPPDRDKHPDYVPAPSAALVIPKQEPGVRPARPVPYELDALADIQPAAGAVTIHFGNTGRAAAVFQVRSGNGDGPWTYTVGAQTGLSETWELKGKPGYDLSVYGPNGFFRSWKGSLTGHHKADLSVATLYECERDTLTLEIRNRGARTVTVKIHDRYGAPAVSRTLQADEGWTHGWPLARSFGWYDLTLTVDGDPGFRQQIAGHLETGRDSMTDPAIG
jgi:phospholipase C